MIARSGVSSNRSGRSAQFYRLFIILHRFAARYRAVSIKSRRAPLRNSSTTKFLALAVLLIPGLALAGKPSANGNDVANDGYDVVAYFTQNAAVRGSNTTSTSHGGVTYYFSSQKHLDMFRENPSSYLPQYDGYCAFAVAKHSAKVKADPKTFKLRDGKLLLFFNDFNEGQPVNTIVFWNGAEQALAASAKKNWKTLASK
jgi:YHS domain-containing protein